MLNTTVIGVGHYSRVGKDSFANELVQRLRDQGVPARKVSFAWKLKEITCQIYGWAGVREPEYYETAAGEKERDTILPALGKSVVELWIEVGNQFREIYGETWVQYALRNLKPGVTVVPDTRFLNEIEAIKRLDGRVIKVIRPGFPPRGSVSDRALLGYEDWDMVIGRSGEIDELHQAAIKIAEGLSAKTPYFPIQTIESKRAALQVEKQTLDRAGIYI